MARQTVVMRLITVSFLALVFVKNANGVEMTATPTNPEEAVDTSVHFTCNLGPTYNKYKEVFVLDIVKDSKVQIAIIRPGGAVHFKHDYIQKRFQGEGYMPNIGGDLRQAFLNVTLLLPRVEDSGTYSCVTSYLNIDGLVVQDKDDVTLKVKKLSTNTKYMAAVVGSLVRRVEKLEDDNKNLSKTVNDLQTSCCGKAKGKR